MGGPKPTTPSKKKKGGDNEDEGEGSRSNHQRLQAVELLGLLIKVCQNDSIAKEHLKANIQLISSVIIRCVQTADSWKNKKVSKTI